MATDPRFASAGLRGRNKEALNEMIADALRAKTSREWFDIIVEAGLPCGPVYNVKDVFADPQVEALAHRPAGRASPARRDQPGGAALPDHRLRPRDPFGDAGPRRTQ